MLNTVIIGAGYSGILTAQELSKKLRSRKDVRITLIDKNPYHTMKTELHAAASGRGKPENIKFPLSKIFAGTPVRTAAAYVTDIDFQNKRVNTASGTYSYDYLVIAAGSKPSFFGIPGAEKFSYHLQEYNDAVHLKNHLNTVFKLAASEKDPQKRKALLTFIIAGAGLTGIELAGELAEAVPLLCTKYNIPKREVTLEVIDASPRALPGMPKAVSSKAEKILHSNGVRFKFSCSVREVTNCSVVLESDGKKCEIPTHTVIWTAGVTGSDITTQAAGALRSEKGSRLRDNSYLMSVSDPSVFVVGDNMYYSTSAYKKSVPQMVENCESSAKTAADNIASLIKGRRLLARYKPSFHGAMISLGGLKGISYIGSDRLGIKAVLPSVPTQLAKRAVNVIYLSKVLGRQMIPQLIKNEFFAARAL